MGAVRRGSHPGFFPFTFDNNSLVKLIHNGRLVVSLLMYGFNSLFVYGLCTDVGSQCPCNRCSKKMLISSEMKRSRTMLPFFLILELLAPDSSPNLSIFRSGKPYCLFSFRQASFRYNLLIVGGAVSSKCLYCSIFCNKNSSSRSLMSGRTSSAIQKIQ
jgi:hypothetical protein